MSFRWGRTGSRAEKGIMPTSSVGVTSNRRGVTLIEMLIVMAVIALVAGLVTPSVSAGLDSLRLRSTSDAMIGFLNTALARAETAATGGGDSDFAGGRHDDGDERGSRVL